MCTRKVWHENLTTPEEVRAFFQSIGRPKCVWVGGEFDWWFGNDWISLARAYLHWDERQVEIRFVEATDEDRKLWGDEVSGAFEARNLPKMHSEVLGMKKVQDQLAAATPQSQEAYAEIFLDAYADEPGGEVLVFDDIEQLEGYLADWSEELGQGRASQ